MELTKTEIRKIKISAYSKMYWPYLFVEAIFAGLVVYVQHMTTVELITLALAASFAGRAIAYEKVFEWARVPFSKTIDHESGIGKYNEPRYTTGIMGMLGNLILCPVCAGTWSAVLLALLPHGYTQVLAAACIAWAVSYATEGLEWWKCKNWEEAGYFRRMQK